MIARIEKFELIPRIDTHVKIAYALGLTVKVTTEINTEASSQIR